MSTSIILFTAVGIAVLVIFALCYLYFRKHYMSIRQREFYSDGALKREYFLLNGVINGGDTFFYPTGEVNKTQQWNHGKLEGPFVVYFKNGNNYIVGSYSNGSYKGEYIVNDLKGNEILRKVF